MFSPATVLKRQKGHVFECATVLCSLLVGVGYDAYDVSGYATREACMADETREDCPLLIVKEKVRPHSNSNSNTSVHHTRLPSCTRKIRARSSTQAAAVEPEKPQKKYAVRPARDLNSKHERMLTKRKVDAEEGTRAQQRKEEQLRELVRTN